MPIGQSWWCRSGPRGNSRLPGQSAGTSISFVVPGVPQVERRVPADTQAVAADSAEAGGRGRRITIDEFGLTMVVLTQDPLVVSDLSQRSARVALAAPSGLSRNLAVDKLEQVESVLQRLETSGARPAAGVSSP